MMDVPVMTGERLPLHILTGFLGSGKTTLLRHLLVDPEYVDTAVVVNEFGDIGLDDVLIREVSDDVALLASGCLCCTVRNDLISTLVGLRDRVGRQEIPAFRRVVIETSGLAEPGAVLRAALSDTLSASLYRAGRVVTVVDAISGSATLNAEAVSIDQVALADLIVVTKQDLVRTGNLGAVVERLRQINPSASILFSRPGAMPRRAALLDDDEMPPPDLERSEIGHGSADHQHRHDDRIASFVIERDHPVYWPAFTDWLDLLLTSRGDQILRIKGVIAVTGQKVPVVVQTVQHLVFPPETLSKWPWEALRSRLVVIARDVTGTGLERSFREIKEY